MSTSSWEPFRRFDDPVAAEVFCAWMLREGVPAQVVARSPESALEAEYLVYVDGSLAHRARWVVAQLPPSEAELEFLATGKLPGEDRDE